MGEIITVVSGKGGTGKTTASGAVSSCLAALGHRTLCLDCDVGLRNLDSVIGMTEFTVKDFGDVLSENTALTDACSEHPAIPGLFFLSAPIGTRAEDVDPDDMKRLKDRIREEFDYCVIDSPAGIGAGFRLAASDCDAALIITLNDLSSIRDGQVVAAELARLGISRIRLIVNRVKKRQFKQIRKTVDDIIDTVGAQLIGLVAEDEAVYNAGNTSTALILYGDKPAAKQFLRITMRLLGKDVPLGRFA